MGSRGGRKKASERDMLEMRRAEVARLSYRGWEVEKIAAKIGMSTRVIYEDLEYVKKHADEVMRRYLVETVPHIINKALSRLDQVNKEAWQIIEAKGTVDRDKISAGGLVTKTARDMVEIITNNKTIVERALEMDESNLSDQQNTSESPAVVRGDGGRR